MSDSLGQDFDFAPSLAELEQNARSTHLLVSSYLRKSATFRIYAAAMEELGIDGRLQPFELPHKNGAPDLDTLRELLNLFRIHPELETIMVSDPYKQEIIKLLDGIEAPARQVGSVNLVFKRAFSTVGDNLDGEAFLMGAEAELKRTFKGRRMVFFGCGGVSSAVAVKLVPMLARVALLDVLPEKSEALRKRLQTLAPKLEVTVLQRPGPVDLRDYDTFYNGTGLGKHRHDGNGVELTPLLPGDVLPVAGIAIDANYTPWETAFLKHLREHGFATLNGFSHMVGSTALHLAFISGRTLSYATIKRFAEQVVERV